MKSITYKQLNIKNPKYRGNYYRQIKALVDGGETLFSDPEMLSWCLPKKPAEDDSTYASRLETAYYVPSLGQAIQRFVSALSTDPLTIELEGEDTKPAVAMPESEDYYDKLEADVNQGGVYTSLNDFELKMMYDALCFGSGYVLLDYPEKTIDAENYAEQEMYGEDRVYFCPVFAGDVYDWKLDKSGMFEWVVIRSVDFSRDGIDDNRKFAKEVFTYYTKDEWTRYTFEFDISKPIKPDAKPTDTEEGKHSFGMVPLLRMCLPDGLWAADKAFSIALQILRKANAQSYAIDKSLFQFAVVYLDGGASDGMPTLDPMKEDINRATNQPVGPGKVLRLAKEDRFEYVGADPGPIAATDQHIQTLRDDMYQILSQMALSIPGTSVALGRSAESKTIDAMSFVVILKALGKIIREHARMAFKMVATSRGEDKEFKVGGLTDFDDISSSTLVQEALSVSALNIQSTTFNKEYTMMVIRKLLPEASAEDLTQIESELDRGASMESLVSRYQNNLGPTSEVASTEQETIVNGA